MSTFCQYHGTASTHMILISCRCQIANIIWTSTRGHYVKNVSGKSPLPKEFGDKDMLVEKTCWLKKNNFLCQCATLIRYQQADDGRLTSTVDIILSALCLVLILYFCLSIMALVEVNHALII